MEKTQYDTSSINIRETAHVFWKSETHKNVTDRRNICVEFDFTTQVELKCANCETFLKIKLHPESQCLSLGFRGTHCGILGAKIKTQVKMFHSSFSPKLFLLGI